MSEKLLIQYELDQNQVRTLLNEVQQKLLERGGDVERNLAATMSYFEYTFMEPADAISLENTVQIIGTAVNDPEFLAGQQRFVESSPNVHHMTILPDKAYEWGKLFLYQMLKEIRAIICTENSEYIKLRDEYKSYPKAFAVAVSAALMAKLGVNGPMALGIATLVLLSLAQATKNSFCTMTDEQVLRKIDGIVDKRRKEKSEILRKHFGE